jgi:hypothetical protein
MVIIHLRWIYLLGPERKRANAVTISFDYTLLQGFGIYTLPGLAYVIYNLIKLYRERSSQFVNDMLLAINNKTSTQKRIEDGIAYGVASICILIAWPAFIVWWLLQKQQKSKEIDKEDEGDFACKMANLVSEVTPIEAEVFNHIYDPLSKVPKLAFGHLNKAWSRLLEQMTEPADQLWSFFIPKGSDIGTYLTATSEVRGYAIVRKGKIVGELVVESD